MDFLISSAWAQEGGAAQDPGLMGFLPLILIFVIFYFLLMRPQIKRAKEHRKMVETLGKGDEVVTSGGLLGRITKLDESLLTLEIADGVRVKVQKTAVSSLMPKGTLKDAPKEPKDDKESTPAQT